MKYLILACAILGVLCSKLSCMNVAQTDQVPFEPIKEHNDSVAVPIPLMEQPVIQPVEKIVLARGYISNDSLYDAKTKRVLVEPFLARLSSVISSPCELVFNFDESFCEMKLIRFMCQTIKNSEHVGNVHSAVVQYWAESPSSKDFAAFKSMLVAFPNLKKLEISSYQFCDILYLSIFNCVKNLEYAKLDTPLFKFRSIINYMDRLSHFASSHPTLKELDLVRNSHLKPKEAVLLIESMQLNSFLFKLDIGDCSHEDVDAINRLKFKRGLKSVFLKTWHNNMLGSTQNADKFLFGFALKLDCLEELSIEFVSFGGKEHIHNPLSTFLCSLPHPKLLTKLRLISRMSMITFDADILYRFGNLIELDLVGISFNLPKFSFHKLRILKLEYCVWNGCLASAFPSVTNVSLLGSNSKSHDFVNYIISLLGRLSVDQFTIELELCDYFYFCKNVVEMKTKEAKFNGKLNIKLGLVCGDNYTPVKDAFANLTSDVFKYFDSSIVTFTIDTLYIEVPIFESLIKNVGKLNLIHVTELLCPDSLPFKKNGENLTWKSEYYDNRLKLFVYINFTCANK